MLEKYRADLTITRAMNAATNGTMINSRDMLVQVGVSSPIKVEAWFAIKSQTTKLSTKPMIPLANHFKTNLAGSLDSLKNSESKPKRKAGHIVCFHLP